MAHDPRPWLQDQCLCPACEANIGEDDEYYQCRKCDEMWCSYCDDVVNWSPDPADTQNALPMSLSHLCPYCRDGEFKDNHLTEWLRFHKPTVFRELKEEYTQHKEDQLRHFLSNAGVPLDDGCRQLLAILKLEPVERRRRRRQLEEEDSDQDGEDADQESNQDEEEKKQEPEKSDEPAGAQDSTEEATPSGSSEPVTLSGSLEPVCKRRRVEVDTAPKLARKSY